MALHDLDYLFGGNDCLILNHEGQEVIGLEGVDDIVKVDGST